MPDPSLAVIAVETEYERLILPTLSVPLEKIHTF